MNSLVHRATRCRRVSATWSCVLVLAAPMALAARTDEPLAEAQALATGIATAGLSRLVELGGSVLSAQLCVVAMRVSGGALALTRRLGATDRRGLRIAMWGAVHSLVLEKNPYEEQALRDALRDDRLKIPQPAVIGQL